MDNYEKYKLYKKKYKKLKKYTGGTIQCKDLTNKNTEISGSSYSSPEAAALKILWEGNKNKMKDSLTMSENRDQTMVDLEDVFKEIVKKYRARGYLTRFYINKTT